MWQYNVNSFFTVSFSLDKALHSAGIDSGFIIFGTNLSNPLNMLLPLLQTVSNMSVILHSSKASVPVESLSCRLAKVRHVLEPYAKFLFANCT